MVKNISRADRVALFLAATLLLAAITLSLGNFAVLCGQLRGETVRLHIIANSDSAADQQNKLLVRDALLAEFSPLLGNLQPQQAQTALGFLLGNIEQTARTTLRAAGDLHPVRAEVVRMYFDTRTYEDGVTLPAGEYTALRVIIGDGAGRNWWCVMYPPLCIPVASAGEAARVEDALHTLNETPDVQARFAVVELAERLRADWREYVKTKKQCD